MRGLRGSSSGAQYIAVAAPLPLPRHLAARRPIPGLAHLSPPNLLSELSPIHARHHPLPAEPPPFRQPSPSAASSAQHKTSMPSSPPPQGRHRTVLTRNGAVQREFRGAPSARFSRPSDLPASQEPSRRILVFRSIGMKRAGRARGSVGGSQPHASLITVLVKLAGLDGMDGPAGLLTSSALGAAAGLWALSLPGC